MAWDFHDLVRAFDPHCTLSLEEARELAVTVEEVRIAAGDVVFAEGDDPGSGLFIVGSGEFVVERRMPSGRRREIRRMFRPEFFGAMSLLDDARRHATIRASTDGTLLRIPRDRFQGLLDRDSLAAFKVVHAIARLLAGRVTIRDGEIASLRSRRRRAVR